MNIPKYSVNNSLAVNLFSVAIVVGGLMVGFQIPREAFPNVNYGFVTITTPYVGSTPKDVEKRVAIPIEDELREVDGIDEVISISLEGLSMIFVQLDIDQDNDFEVVSDIRRAVDRVTDLPEAADDPIVDELNTDDEVLGRTISPGSGASSWTTWDSCEPLAKPKLESL